MVLKDKKTKITFHNGILTIGGTIIEVVYEDSHIFFDFGSEYDPSAKFQPSNLQALTVSIFAISASVIPSRKYLHIRRYFYLICI